MFALKTSKGRGTAIAATTALLAAGFVGITGSAAMAAAASYVITPAYGPSSATPVAVSLTGAGFKNAAGATQVMTGSLAAPATAGVQLATSCGTNLLTISGSIQAASVGVTSYSIPTATRMTAYLKSVPLGSGSIKLAYKLCVYSSASGNPLLGSTTFTVYPQSTVTAVAPAGGPLQGGNTITLIGTDFTKASTVSVGTTVANAVAATNVKVVDGTTITATVPGASAVAAPNVFVTNEGGVSAAAGGNVYTYANTVTLSPKNEVTSTLTTITVTGKGFSALPWPASTAVAPVATAGGAGAWVIFMAGNTAYTGIDLGGADVDTLIDNPAAGYCTNVVVVSDTELTCDAPALAANVYRVSVINNGLMGVADSGAAPAAPALTQTTLSSGSDFVAAAF